MDIQLMVHIDEPLDAGMVGHARSQLQAEAGVVSTEPCRNQTHLMMVRYDPGATSASRIVTSLRRLGLHAQAVGL